MTSQRTRYLAALGGGAVTVALVVAGVVGYDALRSDDSASTHPGTVIETTTPASPSYLGAEDSPDENTEEPSDPAATADEPETNDADAGEPSPDDTYGPMPAPDEGLTTPTHDPKNPPKPKLELSTAARRILEGFARDFRRNAASMSAWHDRMAQWLTPSLARAYATVDPRQLPNTRLDKIRIQSATPESVTAIISYRSIQPFWIVLRPTTDGWRVTTVEPWEAGQDVSGR